jgi:hypothetical protein
MMVSGQAGSFTTLTANNGTLTASAPVLDISQTWNNSGVNFTAVRINIIPTAAQFGGGLSNLLDIQNNGGAAFFVRTNGNANASGFTTFGGGALTLNGQAVLLADASNALAQRSGTNAQTFNIYNTFTSATNHERGFLRWSSNVFQIGTEKGSAAGSARALELQTDGVTRMHLSTGGTVGFGGPTGQSTTLVGWTGNCFMRPINASAGVLTLLNAALDGFNRLQFGGTTSSFPALKRDSATLQVRLADDTGFAPLSCGALTLNGNLDASTRNIVTDTTTGTKIGTATSQKIGFFNATPVEQQAAVADATDAASTQARLNDLLARLRTLGLIAT